MDAWLIVLTTVIAVANIALAIQTRRYAGLVDHTLTEARVANGRATEAIEAARDALRESERAIVVVDYVHIGVYAVLRLRNVGRRTATRIRFEIPEVGDEGGLASALAIGAIRRFLADEIVALAPGEIHHHDTAGERASVRKWADDHEGGRPKIEVSCTYHDGFDERTERATLSPATAFLSQSFAPVPIDFDYPKRIASALEAIAGLHVAPGTPHDKVVHEVRTRESWR